MPLFILTQANIDAAKAALRMSLPEIRSGHLTEALAFSLGFGTAAGLREQFARRRGVSPRAYRQTFRSGGSAPVQLDGHRGGGAGRGGMGGDQPLVEAQLGQPA